MDSYGGILGKEKKNLHQSHLINETAKTILQTRGLKRISFFLCVMTLLMTSATYLLAVYPAFLPADLTNSAVATLIASDEYQKVTKDLFDNLDSYNNDVTGIVKEPLFKLAHSDYSQFGLVVSYQIDRKPQDHNGRQIEQNAGKSVKIKYKYDTDFRVRIDYRILVMFLLIEAALVTAAAFVIFSRRPMAQIEFEEAMLTHFFSPHGLIPSENCLRPSTEVRLNIIFSNFHQFCIQLNRRCREGKKGFPIEDEYDVQDILYALLKLHFPIVKREEPVPSFMGASSKIDFLLPNERIGIEAKMASKWLRDGKLGDGLVNDIARYPKHQECERIIFFVYDPGHLIENPAVFRSDIQERNPGVPVDVIFSPVAGMDDEA